jgi:hypothetical protein
MRNNHIDLALPREPAQCEKVSSFERALGRQDVGNQRTFLKLFGEPTVVPYDSDRPKSSGIKAGGHLKENCLGASWSAGIDDVHYGNHVVRHNSRRGPGEDMGAVFYQNEDGVAYQWQE